MSPEDSVPMYHKPPEGTFLTFWVIYDHPLDVPNAFVLRPQYLMEDKSVWASRLAWYAKTAEELRAILPPGLCKVQFPGDQPYVLETWL